MRPTTLRAVAGAGLLAAVAAWVMLGPLALGGNGHGQSALLTLAAAAAVTFAAATVVVSQTRHRTAVPVRAERLDYVPAQRRHH